ncbi:hypothetical protein [Streptomyces spirodelae]|uniref:Uncharacterized protein n=1 Tax=Streptomyces spirodelae TaxID=2812904 RepID=A0ABS3X3J5_9ACTN|nr:hypothetical protein [Streptomyces spirodelae]MBO8189886.1 hypothetical protein [Streptomyces spirodelae]
MEYRDRVAAITATFSTQATQELVWAAAEAERLDEESTATYGPTHTHTISIRELREWIAGLRGEADAATHWGLHVTGLQTSAWGHDHKITRECAKRTVHHWTKVTSPTGRQALGQEVLAMLSVVFGENSDIYRQVAQAVMTSSPVIAEAEVSGVGS